MPGVDLLNKYLLTDNLTDNINECIHAQCSNGVCNVCQLNDSHMIDWVGVNVLMSVTILTWLTPLI